MEENYVEVVQSLNIELYEKLKDESVYFGYTTNGYYHGITLNETIIWSSEMDERKFDEKNDCYEPLEGFLKQEFNKIADKLISIKF
jgi:hypothetical protein